jgi:hypothetical protein
MKTDISETAIHASYLPWLARIDAPIGEPARLDLTHEFSSSVARGSQPTRGGRRCQEPLECLTVAALADAMEASDLKASTGAAPGSARASGTDVKENPGPAMTEPGLQCLSREPSGPNPRQAGLDQTPVSYRATVTSV